MIRATRKATRVVMIVVAMAMSMLLTLEIDVPTVVISSDSKLHNNHMINDGRGPVRESYSDG